MSKPEHRLSIDSAASWPWATAQMMFFGPKAESPPKNTRGWVEAMVVVGSPNSSNTQRLKEVAERAGCPRAALVQRAKEIDWSVFGAIASLGVLMARVPSRKGRDGTGNTVYNPIPGGADADEKPITMFIVDGDHLVATHYCVVGNQPQMVSSVPDDLHRGVTFSLARITGMKTPDAWHNTGMTFTLEDNDHLTQHWTYLYKGQAGSTDFHYTRKK